MATPRIRIQEGADPQPQMGWDSVWDSARGFADWALATASEVFNRGGLRAIAALETAVVLQLFSDCRMPANHPLGKYVDGDDVRGWWGDGVDLRTDLGETELGSLLWALKRAPLNEETRRQTETEAKACLKTLIDQRVAARIDAQALDQPASGRRDLAIQIYRQDGSLLLDRRFDDIWAQIS
jgi:phage gp46-like protein